MNNMFILMMKNGQEMQVDTGMKLTVAVMIFQLSIKLNIHGIMVK